MGWLFWFRWFGFGVRGSVWFLFEVWVGLDLLFVVGLLGIAVASI